MSMILKGVGKVDGDGWKDATRKGEVVFVYDGCLPPPYAPGRFERVGCILWTASTEQYDFVQASPWETIKLLPTILHDWSDRRRYRFRRNP